MIFQVRAIENGANIESLTCDGKTVVHITVEDVNDENPQFANNLYRAVVRENAPQGTNIITITVSKNHGVNEEKNGKSYGGVGVGRAEKEEYLQRI